jgi:hypothetical protein
MDGPKYADINEICSLRKARKAILDARKAVLEAAEEHDWLYGLCDADDLLVDAAAQISGEISKRLPERPIYEKRP